MSAINAFLLAFPALFSIVNPVGSAFIFHAVTADLSHADRARIAGKVGLYSLLVMLGALWAGTYVLSFFGVSIAALRIGGGVVVSLNAWHLLNAREQAEATKQAEAGEGGQGGEGGMDMAFFPLTMPFTAGPGTISVAVALGAERPSHGLVLLWFFLGVSGAAAVIAAMVWVIYRYADRVDAWLDASARRSLSRLMAFLLLCIGVQILITGVEDVVLSLKGIG